MIQVLAIISASAAGGLRVGLPLLILGLANLNTLWSEIPLLDKIRPEVVIGVLVSWTIFEIFGTKKLLGLRIIQIIQLIVSPVVGAMLAVGAAKWTEFDQAPFWLIGIIGGVFALVLRFVLVGWFFHWGRLPIAFTFLEDILSAILTVFALRAPENGGIIAMLLLWIALRSSHEWRQWYLQRKPTTTLDNE